MFEYSFESCPQIHKGLFFLDNLFRVCSVILVLVVIDLFGRSQDWHDDRKDSESSIINSILNVTILYSVVFFFQVTIRNFYYPGIGSRGACFLNNVEIIRFDEWFDKIFEHSKCLDGTKNFSNNQFCYDELRKLSDGHIINFGPDFLVIGVLLFCISVLIRYWIESSNTEKKFRGIGIMAIFSANVVYLSVGKVFFPG